MAVPDLSTGSSLGPLQLVAAGPACRPADLCLRATLTRSRLPNWNNVVPRLGVSYDLTGQGKTAVKANFGVYVASQGAGFATTYSASVFGVDQRTWTDSNRDDIAQESGDRSD